MYVYIYTLYHGIHFRMSWTDSLKPSHSPSMNHGVYESSNRMRIYWLSCKPYCIITISLPSGNLTILKIAIVGIPIKDGDFHSSVRLPNGISLNFTTSHETPRNPMEPYEPPWKSHQIPWSPSISRWFSHDYPEWGLNPPTIKSNQVPLNPIKPH